MLPSFRFLFAAIVLSMSILVLGLGAAALLRTAHEEFATNPFWHATPETKFTQPSEPKGPALALLRVDPLPAEQETPEDLPPVAAPVEPGAIASVPDESENIAAPSSEEVAPQETAKPENPAAESPAQGEPAAAEAETAAGETRIGANEQASPPANEAVAAAFERTSAPASPEADAVSAKLAALDAPTVAIEPKPPAKTANAKIINAEPDKSVIKKREQARRAAQRRKIAARARAAEQAAQQAVDPFAQPFAQAAPVARSR